jgi:hypothetical protein
LVGLNVLEKKSEMENPTFWSTPPSLQLITAGSTTASKWIGAAITSLGGASALLAGLRAFVGGSGNVTKVGWAASAAACLVATIIGLAIIIKADVSGRAEAASAEYSARALIAAQFLELARPKGQYAVKGTGQNAKFMPVESFTLQGAEIVATLDGGMTLKGSDIAGLMPIN